MLVARRTTLFSPMRSTRSAAGETIHERSGVMDKRIGSVDELTRPRFGPSTPRLSPIARHRSRPRSPTKPRWRGGLARTPISYPWLVFEAGGRVLGYAYGSPHRARKAYQWSVEVSVYVDPRVHRAGVGRAPLHRAVRSAAAAALRKRLCRDHAAERVERRPARVDGIRAGGGVPANRVQVRSAGTTSPGCSCGCATMRGRPPIRCRWRMWTRTRRWPRSATRAFTRFACNKDTLL